MAEQAPLETFVDRLLKSKQVKKLVADHYGPAAKERMKQFHSGDVDELLDLFEDKKKELSKVVHETDGAAPDDDTFQIQIHTFGSVYWITASEFDDVGYFSSLLDAEVYVSSEFEGSISELAEREHTTRSQDEVVAAVLSRASNAKRLVAQFTEEIGDPLEFVGVGGADFPEIASGGFVSRKDLKEVYAVYDELWPLEGRVSGSRMKALEEGAALTPAEKAQYIKRRLAAYFAEPVEGAGYQIFAVTSSTGRRAYWTEIREGDSWEGVEREILGIFPSVAAAKAALRRTGLISARDYRPRSRARRIKGRHNR